MIYQQYSSEYYLFFNMYPASTSMYSLQYAPFRILPGDPSPLTWLRIIACGY